MVSVQRGDGDGFDVRHFDHKTPPPLPDSSASGVSGGSDNALSECRDRALVAIGSAPFSPGGVGGEGGVSASTARSAVSSLVACLEASVAGRLEKATEEVSFQAQIRKGLGAIMENYTCADHGLGSTDPIRVSEWNRTEGATTVTREVKVMLDRPSSRVHVIEDFITDEECQAMEEAALPKLHQATVADGKGGSEISIARKALQAGIKVPWNLEESGNGIATISRKVYEYVNHVLNLGIDELGQEDLMSIQYEGRGSDEKEPDRYTPHCDGECEGLEFKPGNRMATVVMYCMVPEEGGATNFRNSGLHIVPNKGSATFFSYIDPESMIMDNGFTTHSGCPVIKGEKKIVTQWVRLEVDEKNPWSSFNSCELLFSPQLPIAFLWKTATFLLYSPPLSP